ncbi:repetitive organellar protein-like isoform X2 [Prorops nasuta]|uniref:repetitive organellar protein-like isoform X2 n=1 Tax=Prorops nasuta TaxID=863751 RepID=UPI0034CF5182
MKRLREAGISFQLFSPRQRSGKKCLVLCFSLLCASSVDVFFFGASPVSKSFRARSSGKDRPSRMVLTVTEDTPADMLAGSMELLVQLPRDQHLHTQRITVQRSTPMMDLLVQIATAHKLTASSYTLQAIGERGLVLPHQPNTPIGALDALQVQLLPKQGTILPRKTKQTNQPFETTFRLQVHLPRNQLYVSRVSPKMNLGEILDEVCREKNLDRDKYELRHPVNLEETLDLGLSLRDYHLQEVTLYAKQGRSLGSALSSQDIMALQRQEERRRQQAKQSVFGFMFKKSKEGSLSSSDSLGGRSVSPARSDETGRSASPLAPPARPQRKRRPAPKPPAPPLPVAEETANATKLQEIAGDSSKMVISHSRNSSDSSGYHEASILSDNNEAGRLPETLPRRRNHAGTETTRKLAHTSQASKSLCNLAAASSVTLGRALSNTSLSSAGLRKKRAAPPPPPPPAPRPLSSAMSTQALERIVDSEESLTSDIDPSKPPSDIGIPSKANSDIGDHAKANSDLGVMPAVKSVDETDFQRDTSLKNDFTVAKYCDSKVETQKEMLTDHAETKSVAPVGDTAKVETARVTAKRAGDTIPLPTPRRASLDNSAAPPKVPKRRIFLASVQSSKKLISKTETLHDSLPETIAENIPQVSDDKTSMDLVENDDPPRKSENEDVTNENHSCVIKNEQASIESSTEDSKASRKPFESNDNVDPVKIENENLQPNDIIIHDETQDLENDKLSSQPNEDVDDQTNLAESEDHHHSEKLNKVKFDGLEDKLSCSIISTIPKCDHLENITQSISDDTVENGKSTITQDETFDACNLHANTNRNKVSRSQSVLNDFEVDTFAKQKRHLTSVAEDFACALNLNLPPQMSEPCNSVEKAEPVAFMGEGEDGKMVDGFEILPDENISKRPSKTDILLQKVSDTLSSTVTPPRDPTKDTFEEEKDPEKVDEISESKEAAEETISSCNTSDTTVGSQQDTSDYVSAVEDLSINDWEYQLPAPPSAFRDSSSPSAVEDYDAITPRPAVAFKERVAHIVEKSQPSKKTNQSEISVKSNKQKFDEKPVIALSVKSNENTKTSNNLAEPEKLEERTMKTEKRNERKEKLTKQFSIDSYNSNNVDLKKEIISELENKLETGSLTHKESEHKRALTNMSTPRVAPVDNTLSNFTITTYTKQKNLNIFDEVNEQQPVPSAMDVRNAKALPRKDVFDVGSKVSQINSTNIGYKDLNNEMKSHINNRIIQRSKSNVSTSNYVKFNGEVFENDHEAKRDMTKESTMRKSTSITSLNMEPPKTNVKFSQWRENILKRQEEPTEKQQLQSLEVLKSILPQLKNAQRRDEDVSEEYNNSKPVFNTLKSSTELNTVSETNSVESESNSGVQRRTKSGGNVDKQKRYTYAGPPTITLNSWSERPCVNVQIKMDTDYKFGTNNAFNGKTIVNINNPKEDADNVKEKFSTDKSRVESLFKKEQSEVTKKLISHTAPSVFKRHTLNTVDRNKCDEKPVITGEIKKNNSSESRNEIDTSSVNFKELTKTFGQEICLRTKTKWASSPNYRHSEYIQSESKKSELESNFISPVNNVPSKPKKFTSVVGIVPSQNFSTQNSGVMMKSVLRINSNPVVKGLNLQVNQSGLSKTETKSVIPPKPPTMPIITGVTLKSASSRPKSMPVQIDSRDMLLESIRNFGGREKLKSTAVRS